MICPICDKECNGMQGLGYHIIQSHRDKLNTCPLCHKKLNSIGGLKHHLKRVHNTEKINTIDIAFSKIYSLRDEPTKAVKEIKTQHGRKSEI